MRRHYFAAVLLVPCCRSPARRMAPSMRSPARRSRFSTSTTCTRSTPSKAAATAVSAVPRPCCSGLERARSPVLMTLGGDYLSPSAIGTAVVDGQPLAGRQMVDVLNHVGVDWAVLGNHEFDVSETAFRARLAESRFRVVSSNVSDVNGQPFAGNSALRDRPCPGRRTNDSARDHRSDDRLEPASVGAVRAARRRGARAARAAAGKGRRGDRAHASVAGGRSGPRHSGAGHRSRPRWTRTRELAAAARIGLYADRESRRERTHGRDRDADIRARGARGPR